MLMFKDYADIMKYLLRKDTFLDWEESQNNQPEPTLALTGSVRKDGKLALVQVVQLTNHGQTSTFRNSKLAVHKAADQDIRNAVSLQP